VRAAAHERLSLERADTGRETPNGSLTGRRGEGKRKGDREEERERRRKSVPMTTGVAGVEAVAERSRP